MSQTLNDLLVSLDIKKWDLALLGDGSGTTWETAVGFACLSVDRQAGTRMVFTGGYNHGTIGEAELFPYLAAIRYDYYKTHKQKLHARRRVVILSDSQVSVNVGNGTQTAHTNKDVWASYDYFKSIGYDITWKWIGRNETAAHSMSHTLGNVVRKIVEAEKDIDPYKILPTQGAYVIEAGSEWGFEKI